MRVLGSVGLFTQSATLEASRRSVRHSTTADSTLLLPQKPNGWHFWQSYIQRLRVQWHFSTHKLLTVYLCFSFALFITPPTLRCIQECLRQDQDTDKSCRIETKPRARPKPTVALWQLGYAPAHPCPPELRHKQVLEMDQCIVAFDYNN